MHRTLLNHANERSCLYWPPEPYNPTEPEAPEDVRKRDLLYSDPVHQINLVAFVREHIQQAVQAASPLEEAIGREALQRYESALARLRPEERQLIQARVEMQQSYQQIATAHGKSTADAARMAVSRALVRLAEEMDVEP